MLFHHHKLVFKQFPDQLFVHGLPLSKYLSQVITGLGSGYFKPLQALFQDLECTNRLMFHTVNLNLDLVHTVCYLLLHSRLFYLGFQCLKCFGQLLDIKAKLLSESMVILICKALLSF